MDELAGQLQAQSTGGARDHHGFTREIDTAAPSRPLTQGEDSRAKRRAGDGYGGRSRQTILIAFQLRPRTPTELESRFISWFEQIQGDPNSAFPATLW